MTMRKAALLLPVAVLCLMSISGSVNATGANLSCPKAVCISLPFVSVAPPLQVTSSMRFLDLYLNDRVRGQIINHSDKPVFNALVRIVGTTGISQTVPLALPATFPGQANVFEGVFDNFHSPNVIQQIEVISYTTTSTQTYQPVTVVTSHTLDGGSVQAVFGTIRLCL